MTDKIREAFDMFILANGTDHDFEYSKFAFEQGYIAGRQSLMDELESIPRSESGLETLYRLPEGVTK